MQYLLYKPIDFKVEKSSEISFPRKILSSKIRLCCWCIRFQNFNLGMEYRECNIANITIHIRKYTIHSCLSIDFGITRDIDIWTQARHHSFWSNYDCANNTSIFVFICSLIVLARTQHEECECYFTIIASVCRDIDINYNWISDTSVLSILNDHLLAIITSLMHIIPPVESNIDRVL